MNKNKKRIIIAFLVLIFAALCIICITCFKSADFEAEYTKNNLSWSNADIFEDGSVKLDLTNEKTTVSLKNGVKGRIGYNIYLYAEKETPGKVSLSGKDMTGINKNEYPSSLENCDVKCAYRGYIGGKGKSNFAIKSDGDEALRLLVIIEDNNSYPREEQNLPTIANVKFNAEVLLDGQYPRGKDYSFSLKNAQGEVIETVHNDDGYISFSNIALKEKGTYTYYLSQNEGKDAETTYDDSVYKINVNVEEKNVAEVSYEKNDTPKETLPRFSNYKEIKDISGADDAAHYPTNERKSVKQPNYLLISVLALGVLLIIFYILISRKGDAKHD